MILHLRFLLNYWNITNNIFICNITTIYSNSIIYIIAIIYSNSNNILFSSDFIYNLYYY